MFLLSLKACIHFYMRVFVGLCDHLPPKHMFSNQVVSGWDFLSASLMSHVESCTKENCGVNGGSSNVTAIVQTSKGYSIT